MQNSSLETLAERLQQYLLDRFKNTYRVVLVMI